MPAGAVGTVWAEDAWSATAWEAGSWADADEQVIDASPDVIVRVRDDVDTIEVMA